MGADGGVEEGVDAGSLELGPVLAVVVEEHDIDDAQNVADVRAEDGAGPEGVEDLSILPELVVVVAAVGGKVSAADCGGVEAGVERGGPDGGVVVAAEGVPEMPAGGPEGAEIAGGTERAGRGEGGGDGGEDFGGDAVERGGGHGELGWRGV